jgi:hypothetical protein
MKKRHKCLKYRQMCKRGINLIIKSKILVCYSYFLLKI